MFNITKFIDYLTGQEKISRGYIQFSYEAKPKEE